MEDFASYLQAEGLQPRTILAYTRVAARAWEGNLQGWLQEQLRGSPAGTACVYKAALGHWCDFTGQERFRMPRGKRRKRKLRYPLSRDELVAFYSELESEPDPARVVLECLPRTGLRISELCSATVESLTWLEGRWGIEVHGKGGHERRVPLSAGAQAALERYFETTIAELKDAESTGWLFLGRFGGPISSNWVRTVARGVGHRMGSITNPHVLRHTWASNAHRAGVSPTEIQAVLGHISPVTTAIYIHSDAGQMGRAVDLADLE